MAVATTMRDKLDYLVRCTGSDEAEIVARAVDAGLSALYGREIADAYLAGEIGRDEAVLELGEEQVRHLEYARRAVEADVQWGLR